MSCWQKPLPIIARIWHGKTRLEHYETYSDFLKKVAVPDYEKTAGYLKHSFLRSIQNNEGHFTLITYWENMGVIRNFAGAALDKAKYYPEDDHFLLEFEEKVRHYEVFAD